MSRAELLRFAAMALVAGGVCTSPARAESAAVERYRPAPLGTDGLSTARAVSLGHLGYALRVDGSFAHAPAVFESPDGARTPLVRDSFVVHTSAALGIGERVVVAATMPMTAVMTGEAVQGWTAASGAGVGDARLGARALVLDAADGGPGLALGLDATVPTSAARGGAHYLGDRSVRVTPGVMAELRLGGAVLVLNTSATLRLAGEARFEAVPIGHALNLGVALIAPVVGETTSSGISVVLESDASTSLGSPLSTASTHGEARVGVRASLDDGFALSAAVGPGFGPAFGSPLYRGVLSLSFTSGGAPARRAGVSADEDGDGLVLDDRCPAAPEDRDGFEDGDGCPDEDDDGDGILDVYDRAPRDAEDRDGFEDLDGVPDDDNDGDGVADRVDVCPNDAEDRDAFEDEDGCGDIDNDRDGIEDTVDACPLEPGTLAASGCPRFVRVDRERRELVLAPGVTSAFTTTTETALVETFSIVETNAWITSLDVRVTHRSMATARARAAELAGWLVDRGLTRDRVRASACAGAERLEIFALDGRGRELPAACADVAMTRSPGVATTAP